MTPWATLPFTLIDNSYVFMYNIIYTSSPSQETSAARRNPRKDSTMESYTPVNPRRTTLLTILAWGMWTLLALTFVYFWINGGSPRIAASICMIEIFVAVGLSGAAGEQTQRPHRP